MKITIISNLYPPFVRGGAEYIASQLAVELINQGHEVSVITSAPWQALRSFKTDCRIEHKIAVYRFYPLNVYYYLNAARHGLGWRLVWHKINLFNWLAAGQVRRILAKVKPAAVISFNLMGLSFWLPRAIKSLSLKHLHTLHDVQLLHPSGLFYPPTSSQGGRRTGAAEMKYTMGGGMSPWKLQVEESYENLIVKAYQFITRWLFQPVNIVVAPSRWLMAEHISRGFFKNSEIKVIPNPVPPLAAPLSVFKPLGLVNLIYVGQIQEHKGIFWLVQTLKKSSRSDWSLRIVAVGALDNWARLVNLIGDDKRFALNRTVTQAEIDNYIADSHLAIVPSLCLENAPTIITMAKVQGTPVLASQSGGIPELMEEGVNGWMFAPGSEAEFTQKLNRCLDNPSLLAAAASHAKQNSSASSLTDYARELTSLLARLSS